MAVTPFDQLHGFMFYRTGVIADRSFTLREWGFWTVFALISTSSLLWEVGYLWKMWVFSPKWNNERLVVVKVMICTAHVHNFFPASDQNSDIAIKFSDRDFLKENNNLAIRRRFHDVILTFDTLTLNVCHVFKLCTKFERNWTIHGWVIDDLANVFSRAML